MALSNSSKALVVVKCCLALFSLLKLNTYKRKKSFRFIMDLLKTKQEACIFLQCVFISKGV